MKSRSNIDKDKVLQAVVVAEDFEGIFTDFTHQGCSVVI